jgi:hypothetical protein
MKGSAKCREIRIDALAGLRGETSSVGSTRVAEHMAACAACRTVVDEATAMVEAVRQERFVPSPDARDRMALALFDRVHADASAPPSREARWAPRRVVTWAVPAVAAAAAIAAILVLVPGDPDEPAVPRRAAVVATNAAPSIPLLPPGSAENVAPLVDSAGALASATRALRTSEPFPGLEIGVSPGSRWSFADRGSRLDVDLEEGGLLVRYTRRPDGRLLTVHGPRVVVRVTGTVFLVRALPGQGTDVAVTEGRVLVDEDEGTTTAVGANEARLADGTMVGLPRDVGEGVMAWAESLGARPSPAAGAGGSVPMRAGSPEVVAPGNSAADEDVYRIAEREMALGRSQAAADLLETFVAAAPGDPRADTARLDLARLYTGPLARPEEARRHLEAYLAAHPEAAEREVVRELLARLPQSDRSGW